MIDGDGDVIICILGHDYRNIAPPLDCRPQTRFEIRLIFCVTGPDLDSDGKVRIVGQRTNHTDVFHQVVEAVVSAFQTVQRDVNIDGIKVLQTVALATYPMTEAVAGYDSRESLMKIVPILYEAWVMALLRHTSRQGHQD